MKEEKTSMRLNTNVLCMLDDLCKYEMRSRSNMIELLIRNEYLKKVDEIEEMKEKLSAVDTMFAYQMVCGDR